MPNVDFNFFGVVTLLAAAWVLHRRLSRNSKGLPLPPGPKSWPVIGSLFDVPREIAWKGFAKWSDTYGMSSDATHCYSWVAHTFTGDMIYFHVLGQEVVVLNSAAIAHDLLDNRSSIYSHRPLLTMANEV